MTEVPNIRDRGNSVDGGEALFQACMKAMQAFPVVPDNVVMERLLDTFQEELDLIFKEGLPSDLLHDAMLRLCGLGLLLKECDKIISEKKYLDLLEKVIDELGGAADLGIDPLYQKLKAARAAEKYSLSKFIRSA